LPCTVEIAFSSGPRFFVRGMVWGSRREFVIAGLVLGLSLYFYFGTRLLLILVLALVLLCGFGRALQRWQGLLSMGIATFLASGPLLIYFAEQPHKLTERMITTGWFQSGLYQRELAASGATAFVVMWDHLRQSALAFIYSLDRGYFYTAREPMLGIFAGALFVLGLQLALLRFREPRYRGLLVWLALTILLGGWMVVYAPGYHRYLIAAPAVCLLVGRALVVLLRHLAAALRMPTVWRQVLLVALSLALALSGAAYYFGIYIPSAAFADPRTETADRAARLMAELGPEYESYFFGVPLIRLGAFNSVRFLARDAVWMDVTDETVWAWDSVGTSKGALFMFLPERLDQSPLVQEQLPDGSFGEVRGRRGGVLFYTYLIPPPGP